MDAREAQRDGPRIEIRSSERQRSVAGRWRIRWTIQNRGADEIALLEARLPHDRFFAREQVLGLRLPPGGVENVQLDVACAERPGAVIENAFLIFRVLQGGETWRVLARLRVDVDPSGAPVDTCERITVHPVGFAPGGE